MTCGTGPQPDLNQGRCGYVHQGVSKPATAVELCGYFFCVIICLCVTCVPLCLFFVSLCSPLVMFLCFCGCYVSVSSLCVFLSVLFLPTKRNENTLTSVLSISMNVSKLKLSLCVSLQWRYHLSTCPLCKDTTYNTSLPRTCLL